jgi:Fur family transcriptional regulator, peroxide stress response regulator
MAVARETIEQRLGAFMEACASRQVKITHQRVEIYRVLASTDEHPDADAIYRRVRKRIPTISRDTVYRNLKLLTGHGLISIVGMSHERLRFDANMKSHHHFVCMKCGLIRDFYSDNFMKLDFPAEANAFGTPASLHMEIKGICTGCQKRVKGK